MWRIEFTPKAEKQFSKLSAQARKDIARYLERILEANDPFQFGKRLVGEFSGLWRYRVGKYRIICEIQNNTLTIEIISIGKRDSVYH